MDAFTAIMAGVIFWSVIMLTITIRVGLLKSKESEKDKENR